jgi:hypothetical protein
MEDATCSRAGIHLRMRRFHAQWFQPWNYRNGGRAKARSRTYTSWRLKAIKTPHSSPLKFDFRDMTRPCTSFNAEQEPAIHRLAISHPSHDTRRTIGDRSQRELVSFRLSGSPVHFSSCPTPTASMHDTYPSNPASNQVMFRDISKFLCFSCFN